MLSVSYTHLTLPTTSRRQRQMCIRDRYVIVYKPWKIDHKVQDIVSRHNEMNGTPDRLTVWLYYSQYNLDQGKDFYKVIFEYGKSQVTDPPEAW